MKPVMKTDQLWVVITKKSPRNLRYYALENTLHLVQAEGRQEEPGLDSKNGEKQVTHEVSPLVN